MAEAVGLRERKKTETRRAISRAALALATEVGPDAVTVDAIAAIADVSPRTFFNYFSTKEEAIVGFDPSRSDDLGRAVAERPQRETPLAAIRAAFIEAVAGAPEIAEVTRARNQLVRDHPQLQPSYIAGYSRLENALVNAIAVRTGLDPEHSPYPQLAVTTAISAFRIALGRAGQDEKSVISSIDDAFDSLASGLRPPQ
jgi:AcrR family transcriptional regulator